MPGEGGEYALGPAGDYYPKTEAEHADLLNWAQRAWVAASSARRDYEDKWLKFHRQYHSYKKIAKGDWRSQVHIPYVFSIIEAIVPRMFSQDPKFAPVPIGPEDVEAAKLLETLLEISVAETDLRLELVKMAKSALKYGTGVLKNYHRQDIRKAFMAQPVMADITENAPQIDPSTGLPLVDPDGNTLMGEQVTGQQPTGEYEMVPRDYVAYDGPCSTWVNIWNFWPAPDAIDLDGARYVIQRSYRELGEMNKLIAQGTYHLPAGMELSEFGTDDEDPMGLLQSEVGRGAGTPGNDSTRKVVELLEFWTKDGRTLTMANRQMIVRHQANPFWHGEKPYSVMYDYVIEGEFWGKGETESIEHLQDLVNTIWNQRTDNVKLAMNKPLAVSKNAIPNRTQLRSMPGQVIEVEGDVPPNEIIHELTITDVTSSAYVEAQEVERMMERVTGVTPFQLGQTDASNYNSTATGVALVSEAGNAKFAMKVWQMEVTALKRLARQYGSIIQQFTSEERLQRVLGPAGEIAFQVVDPESVQGAVDYQIEPMGSAQSETVKREQAITKLQAVAQAWPPAIPKLVEDVLVAFGSKDVSSYLMGIPGLVTQLDLLTKQQGMAGEPSPNGQASAEEPAPEEVANG